MTHSLIKIASFAALILLSACSQNTASDSSFVKVDGIHFTLNGQKHEFVGTNFWYGAYLGQKGEAGNRERLRKELDLFSDLGITNLRVLGASQESSFDNTLKPTTINQDGSYNENLLVGLDYLLSEMDKRGMKAVIFLNNYWEWSGGMSTYINRFSTDKIEDPAVSNWEAYMTNVARFYQLGEAEQAFKKDIEHIVTRKNTITGKPYSQDPAIMSWQLANEPRPGRGDMSEEAIEAYIDWIDKTAGFIKSLDPNHLVSSGSEGKIGSLDDMNIFIRAHQTKNMDYLTFHMWAKNWGWIDPQNMESTFQDALDNASAYIEEHVKVADSLKKPLVMEEFGFPRDGESFERHSPVTYRDKYYQMVFSKVEKYDAFGGSNFWSWGGYGVAQHDDFWWQPGDPFTGDPAQEPQGLNSVFSDDSTTLQIIKSHYQKLINTQ